jgi:type IV pilus assembly protein PilM
MARISFSDKLKYLLIEPHFPNTGIELNSDAIRLAILTTQNGKVSVQHLDAEKLPPGAIEITPFKANVHSLQPVAEALQNLWSRNRTKDSRVCVLLQDRSALTFNVVLEHAATSAQECLDLIRFKLKKSVPFRIEDAHITYFDAAGNPGHSNPNLWVTIINHAVLHQYEQIIQSALGSECGLVDLCTFNLMNLAQTYVSSEGLNNSDLLYVNLNHDYVSIAITQKSKLMFYRSRPLTKENGVIEEALQEIHPTTMFYVDKLAGQQLERVFVYAVDGVEELRDRVQDQLALRVDPIGIEPFIGTRFDLSNPNPLRSFAPLVGLLASRKLEFK